MNGVARLTFRQVQFIMKYQLPDPLRVASFAFFPGNAGITAGGPGSLRALTCKAAICQIKNQDVVNLGAIMGQINVVPFVIACLSISFGRQQTILCFREAYDFEMQPFRLNIQEKLHKNHSILI